MIKKAIAKIANRNNLTKKEMQAAMQEIMNGKVTPAQIAAFLTGLRTKGETVEELTAACSVMRQFLKPISIDKKIILDTCGTGGDSKHTFNISTVSAIVVAACGVTVAKHGNRSVSSSCGSADLLEGLGVNIGIDQDKMKRCLEKVGIAFLFAPKLHPAMKYATPVRREIGIRTIFNVLGPLSNPAKATHQLVGVYSKDLVRPIAQVLKNIGLKHALVVHGADGLDEITTTGKTFACKVRNKRVKSLIINPKAYGIKLTKLQSLKGGSVSRNVSIANSVLSGKKSAYRDIVILNSAFAIYVADKVKSIKLAVKLAEEVIDTGKARLKLEHLKEFTTR